MKKEFLYRFVNDRYEINKDTMKKMLSDEFDFSFNDYSRASVNYGVEQKASIEFGFELKYIDSDGFIKIKKYCLDNFPLLTNIRMNKNVLVLYFIFNGIFLIC